ncbi:MAG: S8 family serine peptidase [Gemmatimonadaceae bacterium]
MTLRSLLVVPAVLVAGCNVDVPVSPSDRLSPTGPALSLDGVSSSFVLDFSGQLPASLAVDVAAAGGVVTSRMDGIGLAVASSADPGFRARAAKIAGVRSASPDLVLQWTSPKQAGEAVEADASSPVTTQANVIGSVETFRAIQWNVDAISAPSAWTAGYQGAGARVAVIDGGVYAAHYDLRNRVDAARSKSFVPGFAYNQDVGTFWHGTHVAGIIAAEAQGVGTVGVAPQATIIGVKALHNGSGSFSAVINAVYYAATPIAEGGAGANIINMSLGAVFASNEDGGVQLKNALSKATTYAYQRGVTVIVAVGNNAIDFDHTANLITVPAQSAHVIAVAATGPVGFGLGATNFDTPSSYTNFGQSLVTLSGPGGNDQLPGTAICTYKRFPSGTAQQYCFALDFVIAPCRSSGASITGYCWAEGTSMASPAVAGVAALIVGKNGPIPPAQVEAILRQSADDAGKPGNDDYHGRGRVNALRAVQ